MSLSSNEEYTTLFLNYEKDYLQKKSAQIKDGLNDFNPFSQMLKNHDEVRLHGRLFQGLLDPKGNHYKNDQFLRSFLKHMELPAGFLVGFEYDQATVEKEYKISKNTKDKSGFIDLYINDGNKHIVIELKVYASDQPAQTERYIDHICTEENGEKDNICFVYLSHKKNTPNSNSLGEYSLTSDKLTHNSISNRGAYFVSVNWKNNVTKWLNEEIDAFGSVNDKNYRLFSTLQFYRDCLDKLNKKYRNKVMTLSDYYQALSTAEDKERLNQLIGEVLSQTPQICADNLESFIETIAKEVKKIPSVVSTTEDWTEMKSFEPIDFMREVYSKGKAKDTEGIYCEINFSTMGGINFSVILYLATKHIHLFVTPQHNPKLIAAKFNGRQPFSVAERKWKRSTKFIGCYSLDAPATTFALEAAKGKDSLIYEYIKACINSII